MSLERIENAINRIRAATDKLPSSFAANDTTLLEQELDRLAAQDRKQRHALKQSADKIDSIIKTIDGAISGGS